MLHSILSLFKGIALITPILTTGNLFLVPAFSNGFGSKSTWEKYPECQQGGILKGKGGIISNHPCKKHAFVL